MTTQADTFQLGPLHHLTFVCCLEPILRLDRMPSLVAIKVTFMGLIGESLHRIRPPNEAAPLLEGVTGGMPTAAIGMKAGDVEGLDVPGPRISIRSNS